MSLDKIIEAVNNLPDDGWAVLCDGQGNDLDTDLDATDLKEFVRRYRNLVLNVHTLGRKQGITYDEQTGLFKKTINF